MTLYPSHAGIAGSNDGEKLALGEAIELFSSGRDLSEDKALQIIHATEISPGTLRVARDKYTEALVQYNGFIEKLISLLTEDVNVHDRAKLNEDDLTEAVQDFVTIVNGALDQLAAKPLASGIDPISGIIDAVTGGIDKIWTHLEKIKDRRTDREKTLAAQLLRLKWQSWEVLSRPAET